jgi:hypothetical protein
MLRRIKVLAVESPHFTIKLYEGPTQNRLERKSQD